MNIVIQPAYARPIWYYVTKEPIPKSTKEQELVLYAVKDGSEIDPKATPAVIKLDRIGRYEVRFAFAANILEHINARATEILITIKGESPLSFRCSGFDGGVSNHREIDRGIAFYSRMVHVFRPHQGISFEICSHCHDLLFVSVIIEYLDGS